MPQQIGLSTNTQASFLYTGSHLPFLKAGSLFKWMGSLSARMNRLQCIRWGSLAGSQIASLISAATLRHQKPIRRRPGQFGLPNEIRLIFFFFLPGKKGKRTVRYNKLPKKEVAFSPGEGSACLFCSTVFTEEAKCDSSRWVLPHHAHCMDLQYYLCHNSSWPVVHAVQGMTCRRVSLTFYFDCGVGIWCHKEGVNTHVFPWIVCSRFKNSATQKKHS